MKRYDSYKDSGVEWIGEFPNGWKKSKVKYHFHLISGFPFSSEDITNEEREYPIIRIGNVTSGKTDVYFEGELSEKHPLVNYGDYVVSLTGDFSIRKWENKSSLLNQRCGLIKKFTSDDERFLFYYLPFQFRILEKTKYFTTLKNLSNGELLDIEFIVPPLSEQRQIVSFLDTKTSLIDSLIEKTQQKIELLKEKRTSLINEVVTKGLNPNVEMKDSGVEWIGDIPICWNLKQLKHIIKTLNSGTSVNSEDTPVTNLNEYGVLKTSCVFGDTFRPNENKKVVIEEYDRVKCPVLKDSIIFSRMNTPDLVGSNGYVDTNYDNLFLPDRLWITEFIEDIKLSVKWLSFVTISRRFRSELSSRSTGTSPSMKNITKDDLLTIKIPYPSFLEQQQIVEYLDEQTQLIDKTISIEEKRIELLKEYRQSLISEVVTGKRKVVE